MSKMQVSSKVLERRAQVLTLLAKGISQRDISELLKVDESVISRDVKEIQNQASGFIADLAKQTLGFMYYRSLTGINEVVRNAWIEWHKSKNVKYLAILLDAYTKTIELLGDAQTIYSNQSLVRKTEKKSQTN